MRANNTLKIIQECLNDKKKFKKAWQLNDRHYGALTGLNKIEMAEKLGKEKVHQFRRSWDLRPDPLEKQSPFHPSKINIYKDLSDDDIPETESLKDTYERVTSYFNYEIKDKILKENILISAHGNSIRALCKYLFKLNEKQIVNLEIPTGNPLLINFNEDQKIIKCEYLDLNRAKDLLVF